AELDDEPLGAATLEPRRWRREWLASHRRDMPAIGIDLASDPETLRQSEPPPPSQNARDVELDRSVGWRATAHGLGRCESTTNHAPERHCPAAKRGAQLVQQLTAALVETDKRGIAHRDLLG